MSRSQLDEIGRTERVEVSLEQATDGSDVIRDSSLDMSWRGAAAADADTTS